MRREKLDVALISNYFKKNHDEGTYSACDKGDPQAEMKSFRELPIDSLRIGQPSVDRLKKRFATPIRGTTNKDLSDIEKFKNKYMEQKTKPV